MINKAKILLIGAATLINCSMIMADTLPVVTVYDQIQVPNENTDFDTLIFNFWTAPKGGSGSSLILSGYGKSGTAQWLDTDPSTFQFMSGYIYNMDQNLDQPMIPAGPTCTFSQNQFVNNQTYKITVTYTGDLSHNQAVTYCTIQTN